jgi:hypothetical protein
LEVKRNGCLVRPLLSQSAKAALRAQARELKSLTLPTPEQLRKSWTTH